MTAAKSAPPVSVDASCTAITNVRLFDGERVADKTTVVFRGDKISEVAPAPTARCANTVDGTGKTLLPGLIDAHTHAHAEADLASALRYGVTTELDMFGSPPVKAKLRAYAREHNDVSDFFSAGAGVTSPGGHGTEYGTKVRTVDGPNDAEAFVDACVKEGLEYIKIIYTPDLPRFTSISRETPAFVELAKSHKAFVVPTLSVLSTLSGNPHGTKLAGDGAFASRLDGRNAKTLRLKVPGRLATDENGIRESVKLLHAAGVPLLAGTDAPNPGNIVATRRIARVWRGGAELKAMEAPPAEPEPVVVAVKREPGLISDFEANATDARFGTGWKATTDSIAKGSSTATVTQKKGGAHGKFALDVKGEVMAGATIPWGGAMLNPGDTPFAPADLSAAKELVFAVRGAGSIRVMVFTARAGGMPAMKTVTLTKAWKEQHIPFTDLQIDATDVTGIAFVAGPNLGKYAFELDDVALR